jgi:hypothetical protein
MEFVDGDDYIIVAKAVRPMIDSKDTLLGTKRGANKQYRYSSLHIRGFGTHHTVYMDRVDPLSSLLGHLLVDAPEYLAGATATFIVGRRLSTTVYNICKKESKSTKDAAIAAAVLAEDIAGSTTGNLVFKTASSLEKKRSE